MPGFSCQCFDSARNSGGLEAACCRGYCDFGPWAVLSRHHRQHIHRQHIHQAVRQALGAPSATLDPSGKHHQDKCAVTPT